MTGARGELRARVVGVVAAAAVMVVGMLSIGWPAPGIASLAGLTVYWVMRGRDAKA